MLVEQEVGGLDVAVHEPAHVRVLERGRDLPADVDRLRGREPLAGVEQAAQASAPQQLEHHERHVVVAPVVDRHHVRMVQRGRHLRLGAEAAEEAGVVGEGGVEHLHRDPAAQPDVVRHVDATARARADRREQAVAAGEHAAGEIGDATDRHSTQRTGRHDAERGTPERYPRCMAVAKRARVFRAPGTRRHRDDRAAPHADARRHACSHNTDTSTGSSRPEAPGDDRGDQPGARRAHRPDRRRRGRPRRPLYGRPASSTAWRSPRTSSTESSNSG